MSSFSGKKNGNNAPPQPHRVFSRAETRNGQIYLAGTTDGGVVTIENIMTAAGRRVKDFKGP